MQTTGRRSNSAAIPMAVQGASVAGGLVVMRSRGRSSLGSDFVRPIGRSCGSSGRACVWKSLAFVAWAGGAMLLAAPAGGDTYFVDREDDAIIQTCSPIPGDCTLRGAIRKANQRAGSDTIVFTASVDTVLLTISISGVGPT